MRVALNLVYLVPGETGGMEIYARELIPRLAERVDLVALVNREAAGARPWDDVPARVVPVHARNRVAVGARRAVARAAAGGADCDLIHSLASTSPLASRVPRITTIHDLNYKLVPEAHFGLRALGMRALVPAAARRSHRILVDAESTKRDLRASRDAGGQGRRGAARRHARRRSRRRRDVRERFGLGDGPVILSVSAKRPHKNLMRLLEAVSLLDSRPVLVLPGYPTPHEAELKARAAYLGVRAVFPAWVSAEDLEGLYAEAAAFVFPSLAEGFGLPVLEAMARGVPVACSDASSLPEVAGDAALLFDPRRPARDRGRDLAVARSRGGRAPAGRRTGARGRSSPGSAARS